MKSGNGEQIDELETAARSARLDTLIREAFLHTPVRMLAHAVLCEQPEQALTIRQVATVIASDERGVADRPAVDTLVGHLDSVLKRGERDVINQQTIRPEKGSYVSAYSARPEHAAFDLAVLGVVLDVWLRFPEVPMRDILTPIAGSMRLAECAEMLRRGSMSRGDVLAYLRGAGYPNASAHTAVYEALGRGIFMALPGEQSFALNNIASLGIAELCVGLGRLLGDAAAWPAAAAQATAILHDPTAREILLGKAPNRSLDHTDPLLKQRISATLGRAAYALTSLTVETARRELTSVFQGSFSTYEVELLLKDMVERGELVIDPAVHYVLPRLSDDPGRSQ